jgi:hypothetical protein
MPSFVKNINLCPSFAKNMELYHVHWTGFCIGVASISQHLQQKFMEDMHMHHLFEYVVQV